VRCRQCRRHDDDSADIRGPSVVALSATCLDGCQDAERRCRGSRHAPARASEIAGERDGGVLLVRVRAPPADGRANEELCNLIAKHAGVGVRSVAVVCGANARQKLMRIEGIDEQQLRWRLAGGRVSSSSSRASAQAGKAAQRSPYRKT
jgi:uncharacterized protein YggU (UPF0235/DUF167 family)